MLNKWIIRWFWVNVTTKAQMFWVYGEFNLNDAVDDHMNRWVLALLLTQS